MKQKEKIEMFKQFLKDNDCYKKFKVEFKYHRKQSMSKFYKDRKKKDFIKDAFIWGWTIDGNRFWQHKDIKWRDFLNATR